MCLTGFGFSTKSFSQNAIFEKFSILTTKFPKVIFYQSLPTAHYFKLSVSSVHLSGWKIFGIFLQNDTGQSIDPASVYDMVTRGHLMLKPMVSLVKEETEDEVLAAMEEPFSELDEIIIDTPNRNEVVREHTTMDNSEKPSDNIPLRKPDDPPVHDEGLGKSLGQSAGSEEILEMEIATPDNLSVFSDGKTEDDSVSLLSLGDVSQDGSDLAGELTRETIKLISAGQFKLDFEPNFDVEREVEIKRALQRKIEKAKEQCG